MAGIFSSNTASNTKGGGVFRNYKKPDTAMTEAQFRQKRNDAFSQGRNSNVAPPKKSLFNTIKSYTIDPALQAASTLPNAAYSMIGGFKKGYETASKGNLLKGLAQPFVGFAEGLAGSTPLANNNLRDKVKHSAAEALDIKNPLAATVTNAVTDSLLFGGGLSKLVKAPSLADAAASNIRALSKFPKSETVEQTVNKTVNEVPMTGDYIPPQKVLSIPSELPKTKTIVYADGSIGKVPLLNEPMDNIRAIDLQRFKAEPNDSVNGKLPNLKLVPQNKGTSVRKFANTVINSKVATPELRGAVKKDIPTYTPITNKGTLENATKLYDKNPNEALNYFHGLDTLNSADDTALGEVLIQKALSNGDTNQARLLTVDLAEKLTNAGQTVQAASIMKRMSPEGMLMYAQRTLNRAGKELEATSGKVKKPELDNNTVDFILNKMKKMQKMPDGRQKDIELASVMKHISDKLPVTLSKKISSFQTISMLANPKTMIRNTGGNAMFSGIENISNVVGAALDKGISTVTGKRTTLLPSLRTQAKGMAQGAKETLEDFKLGIDTSPNRTQFDLPQQQVFKGKLTGTAEKVTGLGLKLGDRPFWQAAYNESLRQQMKIAKLSEPTAEMAQKAKELADYRTYQDVNKVTQLFQGLKNTLNKVGTKDFGLGDLVIKFPKTPANILARALDYSPAGVVNVIKAATKHGFDQKAFVDSLSRTITGSGAIVLGYELAKNGVITGQANKDKDLAALQKNLGMSEYSFNSGALQRLINGGNPDLQKGDTYRTYDWAQPMSIPLAIGADIFMSGKDKNTATQVAIDAIRSGGTTLFKQSLLQGLQRFMGGYSPVDNIAQTVANTPAGFVPTILKQVAQMKDDTVRNTSNGDLVQQGLNLVKAKIPGVSQELQPKIDTKGQVVKQYQGNNNLWNVAVNPGFTTKYNPSATDKEILRIYNSTGNKEQFPRVAPKAFTWKSQNIQLTPEEYTQYQTMLGQLTQQGYDKTMSTQIYKLAKDDAKAKMLSNVISDVNEVAKQKILKQRGLIK